MQFSNTTFLIRKCLSKLSFSQTCLKRKPVLTGSYGVSSSPNYLRAVVTVPRVRTNIYFRKSSNPARIRTWRMQRECKRYSTNRSLTYQVKALAIYFKVFRHFPQRQFANNSYKTTFPTLLYLYVVALLYLPQWTKPYMRGKFIIWLSIFISEEEIVKMKLNQKNSKYFISL